ncbi:asparagine synthase (glutamine-hydrolyzing) [bacterium]|nr:asparagine synthase (glutamine-hydrolyzing) [bacterium]
MCGIIGFFGRRCDELESLFLPLLKHRGPDESNVLHGDDYSFGHTRLSILGIEDGAQPITDSKGNVLVYNGEIYNCHDLQKEHLQTSFRSDAKILFELLKKLGERALPLLKGMFAFAFLKASSRSVILARDPFGMKPLFFSHQDGVLFFSSELKAMKPGEVEWESFYEYLYFSNPLPGRTLYKGIEEIKPAEYLIFSSGKLRRSRYSRLWQLLEHGEPNDLNLGKALERSLSSHLLSDVPVGLLLSGGMDSSSLALASSRSGTTLDSYCLGYSQSDFDESETAKGIADHLQMPFERVSFPQTDLHQEMEEVLLSMDQPFGDPSYLPTYLLTRSVAKNKKVVLGGDGGDEIFYGYPTFQAEAILMRLPKLVLSALYTAFSILGKTSSSRVDFREKILRFSWGRGLDPLSRHSRYMSSAPPGFFSPEFFETLPAKLEILLKEDGLNPEQPWSAVFFYYFRIYLANQVLVKTDRASMANSLEVRCPFLDVDFLKSTFRYPGSHFPLFERPKQALRDYLNSGFPTRLLRFEKKGFATPLGSVLPTLKDILEDRHGITLPSLDRLRIQAPYLLYNVLVFLYFHPEDRAIELLHKESGTTI